jgi:uncharacterized repeat protein (TIGR01451 family)
MSLIRRREANATTQRAGLLRKSVAQLAVLGIMATGAFAALAVPSAGANEGGNYCHQLDEVQSLNNRSGVAICKTGPETAVAGTDVTYTLDLDAWGRWDKDFTVTDQIPEGTTLVSVTPSTDAWDCSNSADPYVECNAYDVDPEDVDNSTITVVVTIASSYLDEGIYNCADISQHWSRDFNEDQAMAEDFEGNGHWSDESCWGTDVTRESDISIEKTGPASLEVPADIVYTITATNNGPSDSDPVTVEDTFPANTTFVTTGGGIADWTCADSHETTLSCTTLAGLASGASASFTLTLHVDAAQATHTLENCAAVTSGDTSGVTDNDSQCTSIDGVNVTLVKAADVVVPVPVTGVSPRFTG